MNRTQSFLVILFFISTRIFGFDLWIATDGNEELPFQIKSDNPDGSGKIYLYSMTGQRLHLIRRVDLDDDFQHVSVLFDDGEFIKYKKFKPKITKYLVVDRNNRVFILVNRHTGLSKPKWALYRFNSGRHLMTFEDIEANDQANHFYVTLSTGEVDEYVLAEEHPIPPMLDIPEIGACF